MAMARTDRLVTMNGLGETAFCCCSTALCHLLDGRRRGRGGDVPWPAWQCKRRSFACPRRFTLRGPMPLPIVHHPGYDAGFPPDHRFPMDKYRALIEHLAARGLAAHSNRHQPAPAEPRWLKLAHDPAYV